MKAYAIKTYVVIDSIGIILFKLILDFSYISFVARYYEYMGFTLDFNIQKYMEGWMVYFLLFALLSRHKRHVLYMTLLISFLLLIAPTITLYAFRNEPMVYFYAMIIPYAGLLLTITTKRIRMYYFPYGKQIAILLSFCMVATVFLHYLLTVGFEHINFNLSKVYELRRSAYGIASNAGIFSYLNSWVTKVFNIFLIAVALMRKKYFVVFLLVLVQVLLFGFSGHKEVLFSLLLLAGLYFFDKAAHYSTIIIYSFFSMIVILLVYFYLFNEPMLPSILIRRVFFVPTDLNYVYCDYFSTHDHIYWSNSIFKNIFTYPYDVDPVFVIGDYLGHPKMAANTGIFGSGYMHLGIVGILFYMFILSFIINAIQQFNKLPVWFLNAVVLMPVLTIFISSDLPTTLFTHGLLMAILILYLYSSSQYKTRTK